jgi:hypothetical protein
VEEPTNVHRARGSAPRATDARGGGDAESDGAGGGDSGGQGRGLRSSTFRLNVSIFCGYVGCMIFSLSIRQGDTGRCDLNGLS